MKYFITGIEGFVGHYLARHLLDCGQQVEGGYFDGQAAGDLKDLRLFHTDLRKSEQIEQALAGSMPDVVVHLAAQSSPALSFKNPQMTFEVNLIGTVNLLESMRNIHPRARLLLVSSCEVYGPTAGDKPITEDQPYNPISPYASSKVFQEMACLQYHRTYGLEVVVARPFPHTGPGQPPNFALPSFARQIAEIEKGRKDPVITVGNLSALRDLSDVRDVVRAYRLLADKGRAGQSYNICSGRTISIDEALQKMLKLSGYKITIETDKSLLRPADVPVLWGDNSKIRSETGWVPDFKIDQTLANLLDHWRTNE